MISRALFAILLPTSALLVRPAISAETAEATLERTFKTTVHPFVETYCLSCHGQDKPEAELDLTQFTSLSAVLRDFDHWNLILERVEAGEMPAEKAKKFPSDKQRQEVVTWIRELRKNEASKHAGDPGPVLARRLSNAEYDYTIRDLTGADLRPTKEFPVDPANQAGFDNTGESLAMSPALLKKYLGAAQKVAEHLVLKLDGIDFAPNPVLADTDRDLYFTQKIIDFYQRQPTDFADYFQAAWRFQNRTALNQPKATLTTIAAESKLAPQYLAMVWSFLAEAPEKVGPVAKLQAMWRALPAATSPSDPALRAGCEMMRNYVMKLRDQIIPDIANMRSPGIIDGSPVFVLWKNREMAANRRRYDPTALQVAGEPVVQPTATAGSAPTAGGSGPRRPVPVNPNAATSATYKMAASRTRVPEPELVIPADPAQRPAYEASFARFASVFPDTFYISERARVYANPEAEKILSGRLLSAGYHSMTGYFRDDGPLYDLILSDAGRRELDAMWQDFFYVAAIPQRTYTGQLWYEHTDSAFLNSEEFFAFRSEDKSVTEPAKVKQLGELYLAKAIRMKANEAVQAAIKDHFQRTAAEIQHFDAAHTAAEVSHLTAVQNFAARAYRRPLAPTEGERILAFYHEARAQGGLDHEEAMRDCIARVLMSPNFLYRIDLGVSANPTQVASTPAKKGWFASLFRSFGPLAPARPQLAETEPLSDYALASRLSYFLWSTMPDAELLTHAAAGDLHQPKVLAAQARRMLKDDRIRHLSVEFGGNWLDFRRFEESNTVDRERFPAFTNELREAMFEEPVRFTLDLVQSDKSVLNFIYGDYTFVNPGLAQHYGMPAVAGAPDHWVRVDHADKFDRGGLLPMAVFLTANSPGLRTSPVKRGNWVVRRILGERIPAPPPNVPALPPDESKMVGLSLRDALARHREDKSCASCHARFDSFGLVFEGFGPIGERREKDLGDRAVDTRAQFPGGSERSGVAGLRAFLHDSREADFVDNLSRKLTSYALGRTLLPSDDLLIAEMRSKLAANGHRFSTLVESIVTSPQFLTKRTPEIFATVTHYVRE